MKKPSFSVRRMQRDGHEIDAYAVDEHYEDTVPFTCTAGHPTFTAAEASAAALQGAIERFAARNPAPAPDRCSSCEQTIGNEPHIVTGTRQFLHLRCYGPTR